MPCLMHRIRALGIVSRMAALDVHKDRIMVALAERECAILTAVVSGKTLSENIEWPLQTTNFEPLREVLRVHQLVICGDPWSGRGAGRPAEPVLMSFAGSRGQKRVCCMAT